MQGPRIRTGAGPISVAYADMNKDGINDLIVSDSGSQDVMLIPGRGKGFFDDTSATTVVLTGGTGPVFVGPFGPGGPGVVTLDPSGNRVTLISGLGTGSPVVQAYPSGGINPVSAVAILGAGGFEDLVVANREDGQVVMLAGGPDGLTLEHPAAQFGALVNPTSLAVISSGGGQVDVLGVSAQETAAVIVFALSASGTSPGGPEIPESPGSGASQGLTLLSLSDSALPLIATVLTPAPSTASNDAPAPGALDESAAVAALASNGTGFGQALVRNGADFAEQDDFGDLPADPAATSGPTAPRGSDAWKRVSAGTEDAFDEFRKGAQDHPLFNDAPPAQDDSATRTPAPAPSAPVPLLEGQVDPDPHFALVDAALVALTESRPLEPAPTVDPWLLRASCAVVSGCLVAIVRPTTPRRGSSFSPPARTFSRRFTMVLE
jgi:hypothetical protein